MATSLVTVYITNYNYAAFIRQSIESLLGQSYPEIEILIIDDGSTDDSRVIINEYESIENVTVIYQKNKGLNATNNVALKLAKGEYIMRLDADDYLHPDAVSKLVDLIESEDNVALTFADYYNVDVNGETLNKVERHNFKNEVTLPDQPAHGACTLINTSILRRVGGYDEEFTRQDGYDLWLKIINQYKVLNTNEALFYYRQHGNSITDNERSLLSTRAAIKAKHVERRNIDKPKVLAVVPVRGNEYDPRSTPLKSLGAKPLINWTIDATLKVDEIIDTVVSTSSIAVKEHIEKEYSQKVIVYERDRELSRINTSVDATIVEAVNLYVENADFTPDFVLVLFIEAPFRNEIHMKEAIDTSLLYDVDSVDAVRPEDSIFYIHDGSGLKYLNKNPELQLEREEIYRRVGGMQLIDYNYLMNKGSIIGEKAGHIILDQIAATFIRTQNDFFIAERITELVDQESGKVEIKD